jgi:hypothetical protein
VDTSTRHSPFKIRRSSSSFSNGGLHHLDGNVDRDIQLTSEFYVTVLVEREQERNVA